MSPFSSLTMPSSRAGPSLSQFLTPPISTPLLHNVSSPQPSALELNVGQNQPEESPPPAMPRKEKQASTSTYKHRNVYKSIIRHMYSYIRKQRSEIVGILQKQGFSMQDVEHAFYEIGCYNDMERQKGKKKVSQSLVKRIATDKTIYTYVLRETLNTMLKNWDEGKFGRLTKKNVSTYKDVCQKYYNETVKALGQSAQGASLPL